MKLALVGDIGGTNARFALWEDEQLRSVSVLATADYACPEDAITVYLNELNLEADGFDVAVVVQAVRAVQVEDRSDAAVFAAGGAGLAGNVDDVHGGLSAPVPRAS